jgi:hypothetical protein
MDLNQEPLPPPPFPRPPQPPPPEKPPDLFSFPPDDFREDEEHFVPHGENPEDFLEKHATSMREAARELRDEIKNHLRGPLQFHAEDSLNAWYSYERTGLNKDQFMIAFKFVTTALDAGYYPSPGRKAPYLDAQDWAALASAVLAAVGRGYARSHSEYNEDYLDLIRRSTTDLSTDRSDPPFKSMFERLTATAEHLHQQKTLDYQVLLVATQSYVETSSTW